MKKTLFCLVTVLWMLSGCVTETTVIGKNTERQVDDVDPVAASKTRVQLGLGYLRKGDMAAAKYNLEKASELNPKSIEGPLALAYYYQVVGDKLSAEKEYEKLLSSHSNDPDVLNNYGTFLCRNKNYDRADALFQRAVAQPSYLKMDSTYENAGLCAESAGKYDNALKYYRLALGYSPNNTNLMLELAGAALKQRQPEEAVKWLKAFREKSPDTPQSLWLSLQAAQARGRIADVHIYGQTLMQQFPSSTQAKRYQNNDY